MKSTAALCVDRKAGIIRGVKVLGLISENGRRYTPAAVKAAADLYEGVRVNVDHPHKDAGQPRSAYDRLGRLVNIRYVEGEGLYGDLEILMSHPMARRICEAAERMPDAFGLSHNAQGEGEEDKGGVFVVSRIAEVRHVDLVADPATTRSLNESKLIESDEVRKAFAKAAQLVRANQMFDAHRVFVQLAGKPISQHARGLAADFSQELKKLAYQQSSRQHTAGFDADKTDVLHRIEASAAQVNESKFKEAAMNDKLKDALEAMREALDKLEGCMKEAYGDAEEGDGEYKDDEKDAMEAASDSKDSEEAEDDKEKADAEEAEDADSTKTEEGEPDSEDDGEDDGEDGKKRAMESKRGKLSRLARENRQLKAREHARTLCESAGVRADADLLNDLAAMPHDAAKRTVQRLSQKTNKPRSGYAITESRAGGIPEGDALFNWLAN